MDEKKWAKDGVERMVTRWAGAQPGSSQVTPKKSGEKRGDRERVLGEVRQPPTVIDAGTARRDASQGTAAAAAQRRLEATKAHLVTEIVEPAKRIGILDRCDVLVVGGGPAGLSAAIGASRAGADTLLLERYGCLGGVITTAGMETLGWYRYEGTVDCEGIGREMERAAERMGGTTKWPYNDSDCLDAEKFKSIADKLVIDAGVRPILHCWCVDVLKNSNDEVIGVITESKSGRQAILAKRVVDCTGDADVAYLAGCQYSTLPREDRMGCTSVFNVAGIDKNKFLSHVEANPKTYADWSDGDNGEWQQETTGKEEDLKSPFWDLKPAPDTTSRSTGADAAHEEPLSGSWSALSEAGEATNLNLVHMRGYDCIDVRDLTAAEMQGRRRTADALAALRHGVPGFENAKLRNHGMTVGVRDTRKIIGRHNLTSTEVREQARFDDAIGVFPEFIDGYSILILPTTGRYFQVPLGCMVPIGADNLLVAGRCVAGDKTSHAAMRNMMACTVTGQGAGVTAAISIREEQSTSSVDIRAVQAELRRQGVKLT